MAERMQQRRGTAAEWALADPVLAEGELGVATDTGVIKSGDGVKTWSTLSAILGSTYLPLLGKAADSDLLDGLDSSNFLRSFGKAADSSLLNGFTSTSGSAPSTAVIRDSANAFGVGAVYLDNPVTAVNQAVRKDYVDSFVDAGMLNSNLGTFSPATVTWSLITQMNIATLLKGLMTADLVNGKLICGRAGTYLIGGTVSFAGGGAGNRRQGSIYKNGVIYNPSVTSYALAGSQPIYPIGPALIDLAVNDYVQLAALHDNGSAWAVAPAQSMLSLSRVV